MKQFLERSAVAAALCWLLYLAFSGQAMQQGQFVAFEAAGLMNGPPDGVGEVTLVRSALRRVLARQAATGWTLDGRSVAPALMPRLALALKFLHTARPLRQLGQLDEDPGYGFSDASALRVSVVQQAGQPPLELVFGKPGADATTQYVADERSRTVWLMSRFVGEEWEAVWDGVR